MKNRTNQRLEAITTGTLIVGVDVAKSLQWARFTDYRGIEIGKSLAFKNDREGFENIIARIKEICKGKFSKSKFKTAIIGMEPTGHYWKTLANYLIDNGLKVVCVNPYHTKKAKELDDNSPTKNDKKDALTIARLMREGRYFDPYLPGEEYGELRGLNNARTGLMKRSNAVKNTITAILDEYFPEIWTVFKHPLNGKASRQILKTCPFPAYIFAMGEDKILAEIKKVVKRSVGINKVRELIRVAEESIGVEYGIEAAKVRIGHLVEELDLLEKQLGEVELLMKNALYETGYADFVLGIKGIGVVTAAGYFGEIGDPMRFKNARQIANYAGYNLVEDSSGKSKSGTCISKRGRGQLRSLLYQMAFTMVGSNPEMKQLYQYLTTRKVNPLKKKQALVVVSKKIITVIFAMIKKRERYNPELVLVGIKKEILLAA